MYKMAEQINLQNKSSKQLKYIFCEDQFLQMWIHLTWAETNS